MKALLILADAVNESDGKLNLLGAGWTQASTRLANVGIAVWFSLGPAELDVEHEWQLELVDAEGSTVSLATPSGQVEAIGVTGQLTVGAPEDYDGQSTLDIPVAVNVGPLELPAPGRYAWRLTVDGGGEAAAERDFLATS